MKTPLTVLTLALLSSIIAQAQQRVNFEDVVAASLAKSEEIQSKESELRSTEASLTQSKFNFLPNLNLVGSYSESGSSVEDRSIGRRYGIQSNMNIFKFGGDYFGYKSTGHSYDSARWDLQNTKITMEEAVALKILEVISKSQESDIRRKLFASQRSYSAVAERRFSKGILPRQELDKLTIDSKIAEARLKDAELAEFQAAENLKVFSGDIEIVMNWPWLTLLKKVSHKNFKFDVKNHPQWQFLKSRSETLSYFVSSKKSELWPSLDLALSYQNESNILNNYAWSPQWGGVVTLTIPLFNRYENAAALRVASETQVRSNLNLQKASRELESAWRIAEKDFRVQLESAIARDQTLKVSRSLYHDNLQRFQAGRANANELFSDQDRLYQTELLAVQGWYAAHASYIKLCHSVGLLMSQCSRP